MLQLTNYKTTRLHLTFPREFIANLAAPVYTSLSPHHQSKAQQNTDCNMPTTNLPSMSLVIAALTTLFLVVPGMLAQYTTRPALEVRACPTTSSVSYNTSVPESGPFPLTQVDLCYDDSSIHIKFTAFEEKDFYCMFIWLLILPGLHPTSPLQSSIILT